MASIEPGTHRDREFPLEEGGDPPASFEAWNRSFLLFRIRVLYWFGLAGLSTFAVRGGLSFGWSSPEVVYRLLAMAPIVVLLFVVRVPLVQRYLDWVLVIGSFAVAASNLEVTAVVAGTSAEAMSLPFLTSAQALTLIFVAVAVTVPTRWATHAILQAILLAYFTLRWPEFLAAAAESDVLVGTMMTLLWVCVVCDVSVLLYTRLHRSQFAGRQRLGKANAALEGEAETRKSYLDGLVGIGISATAVDPLDQARSALDEMIRLFAGEHAFLFLSNDEGQLEFRAGRSAHGRDFSPDDAVPFGLLKDPHLLDAAAESRSPSAAVGDGGSSRSWITVPLRMRNRFLGAIYVERCGATGGLSGADQDFVQALASHVAIALETVRSTDELRLARDLALEAGRAKDAFLQTMSHELRTPLNAIIGYSELVMEELEAADETGRGADVRKIHGAAGHLLRMISNILELTKLEADRISLHAQSFDVAELVLELAEQAAPLAEQRGNRLDLRVAANSGTMHSDRGKIAEVLLEILKNAFAFTEAGQATLSTRRVHNEEGERVEFEISDTGIGMTGEQLERAFEPFYQADMSATRVHGGTGLGLTVARRLAERLGGAILLQSAPEKGSTFLVSLPADLNRGDRNP